MFNLQETKIKVESKVLQEGIDFFVDYVKDELGINLENTIISDEKNEEIDQLSLEVFDEYKVYDQELLGLIPDLYSEGYNVLEKALELNDNKLLIVNLVLRDFVFDKITQRQNELQKTFENNNQQESKTSFER